MKKAAKKTVVDSERLIDALEGIIRDYRAGRGDVLNRAVNDQAPDFAADTLGSALTAALFGNRALPAHGGGAILVTATEHAALFTIGRGSAERGVEILIKAGLEWMRRDRAGVVAFLRHTMPQLGNTSVAPVKERGLFGAELWDVPVEKARWLDALQRLAWLAVPEPRKQEPLAGDVIRAMALSWGRPDFPGRAFGPSLRDRPPTVAA